MIGQTLPATSSQRLRQKIGLMLPTLNEASGTLWSHERLAEFFPDFLFVTHCVMRTSVPLMESALGQARQMQESDPVAAGLAEYLAKHIPEEKNHDEWLLDDLVALGVERRAVLDRVPPATVAALTGSQYYWIFHYHPVALLGYIAVLEGYPPTVDHLEEAVARTGLPRDGFRTFFKHAHLDLYHRQDLFDTLDELPLTEKHQTILGISGMRTVHLVARSLKELVDEGERRGA